MFEFLEKGEEQFNFFQSKRIRMILNDGVDYEITEEDIEHMNDNWQFEKHIQDMNQEYELKNSSFKPFLFLRTRNNII
jgi:hypothetical protein